MAFRRSIVVAACAAALFTHGAVRADTTASATISNISIRLFDLNATDGVAPQITWQTAQSVVQVSGQNVDQSQTYSKAVPSPTFMAPLSTSGSATGVGGQAAITADSLSASGLATAARTSFSSTASTGHTSFNTGVLSPMSQMVFTAAGFVSASTRNVCVGLGQSSCNLAQATVRLTASSQNGQPDVSQFADAVAYAAFPNTTNPTLGDSESILFSWTLTNFNTAPLNFQFRLEATAMGNEFATPVPEAGTSSLMALGLAGLGVARRSRRKNR